MRSYVPRFSVVCLVLALVPSGMVRGQGIAPVQAASAGLQAVKGPLSAKPLIEHLVQSWETGWIDVTRTRYTLDGLGRAVETVAEDWDGFEWVPFQLAGSSYDEMDRAIEYVISYWGGGSWIPQLRQQLSYDGNGFDAGYVLEIRDGGQWVPVARRAQTNGAAGLILEYLEESYDGSAWRPTARGSYTYDGEAREVLYRPETWEPASEIWLVGSQRVTSYGTDGAATTVYQTLEVGVGWRDYLRNVETVDEFGRVVEIVSQDWVEGAGVWLNMTRENRAHDNSGRLIEYAWFEWYGGDWTPQGREYYEYDGDGDLVQVTFHGWDAQANEWSLAGRSLYLYAPSTAVEPAGQPVRTFELEVYPTPSAGDVTISVTTGPPSRIRIEAFDLLGRRVTTIADRVVPGGVERLSWSTDGLPGGMYWLRIEGDGKSEVRSVVLSR